MSIRRRTSTSAVDIWITNNSNDVNVVGSLRWAIVRAHNFSHTLIKVAPDFIDLAGVGRNMYVAGTSVNSVFGGVIRVKDITIDFSNFNVIFGTGGWFHGGSNMDNPTFKMRNMVVENQDFGTRTLPIFANMIDFIDCRFENLVMNISMHFIQHLNISNTTNCIFRNVVNNNSLRKVLYFSSGTHIVDNCIFDNTVGFAGDSVSVVNFSRCYINVSDDFVRFLDSPFPTFNFSQCHVRNSGTNTDIGLMFTNCGAVTNCTFVNMKIARIGGYSWEKPSNIRHCTQIYTLPSTYILNGLGALAHTIQNNIFISPNSRDIFANNLTNLTESNNLYLCVNANARFPNSTHYPTSTPITTLIDTNEQGIGETFKRYYLPTMTNNVARLAGVLQNQIEQDRTNPTNIGAI